MKRLFMLTPLVLSAIVVMSIAAQAQQGNRLYAVTPYSWPQFKATYGLPSTPTVLSDSGQSDAATYVNPGNYPRLTDGDQLISYLLGDFGQQEPPFGPNNMLDLEAGAYSGADVLEAWVGPFYESTLGVTNNLVVDDDLNLDEYVYFPPSAATNGQTGTTPVTTVFGNFETTGVWTQLGGASVTPIPPLQQNYYGDSYHRALAVNRAVYDNNQAPATVAQWTPYLTTGGYYSVYAWFPSEDITDGESHVADARYEIHIGGSVYTQYVSQISGGAWIPLGGPYYFPATSSAFSANSDLLNTNPPVYITLDVTTSGATSATTYVVADAIELRASFGQSLGTPTAVNITAPILANGYTVTVGNTGTTTSYSTPIPQEAGTVGDYYEIALGYDTGNPLGDGNVGGLPISYVTDSVTDSASGTPTTAVPVPQYFNGSVGYNPNATSNAVLPTGLDTIDPAQNTKPIDQVVYFTRTENVLDDPYNNQISNQLGFLYCTNGQSGDIIWKFPGADPEVVTNVDGATAFSTTGTFAAGDTSNDATSYNNETYNIAAANPAGSTATFNFPNVGQGNYFVDVWFPQQGANNNTETYNPAAIYTLTYTSAGVTTTVATSNPVNQTTTTLNGTTTGTGGRWIQLTFTSAVAPLVTLPVSGTYSLTVSSTSSGALVADAAELLPEETMAPSDSTPAVVRNLQVYDSVSKTDLTRTVVIAADNAGKIFCVDAAGNGDGDDIQYDSNTNGNLPVYVDSSGNAWEDRANTIPAVLPLHPYAYGTTHPYWVFQPNTSAPLNGSDIIDLSNLGQNAVEPSPAPPPSWMQQNSTQAYDSLEYFTPAVARSGAATETFTYSPAINPAKAGPVRIYVWDPGNENGQNHINDAEYTVVDDAGNKLICSPVDQTVTTPGWVPLVVASTGVSLFNFSAATPNNALGDDNTITLDNTTADAAALGANATVIADAVEIQYTTGADANSNLIGPLAFQTCSPTVHPTPVMAVGGTTPVTYNKAYNGFTLTYDEYAAKIYIGNSNGVLYALDGTGNADGVDPYQRDYSEDPYMPSPSVDWWFNVGVTDVDQYGEIVDETGEISSAISGTPAYYTNPAPPQVNTSPTNTNVGNSYDEILFTTYSPNGLNQGALYAVNAQGPVGYYGTGTVPDAATVTDYRLVAGLPDYNLQPIPYFSFPDQYGTLHLPNGQALPAGTVPVTDHYQSPLGAPPLSGTTIVPPSNPLGDAAGSPAIFGGTVGTQVLPDAVYFAANDPTIGGATATSGRVWGVELPQAGGTVDTSIFTYPAVNAANGGAFDPDVINQLGATASDANAITDIYDTANGEVNTLQFGPFTDGPVDMGNQAYYVSSSPAVGVVHTIVPPVDQVGDPGGLTGTIPNGDVYDTDYPMLYVGDLNGILHSITLNLGAGDGDVNRYIQDSILDGSAIISTPALLTNGNTNGNAQSISTMPGNNAGGVLFVTTNDGALWESEAFPFIENGLDYSGTTTQSGPRDIDFEFGGPGGFSSVSSASFNIDNFQFTTAATAGVQTNTITGTANSVDTSEWVYASSDAGWTYGLTVDNTSLGNGIANGGGNSFNPGGSIPPGSEANNSTVSLNRNFFSAVSSTDLIAGTGTAYPPPTGTQPPSNPVFDWGQNIYIMVYGTDNPTLGVGSGTTAPTQEAPRGLSLSFTIGPQGSANNGATGVVKTVLLSPTNTVAITGQWPPVGYSVDSSSPTPDASAPVTGGYATEYVYELTGPSTGDPMTPGTKIQITDITETALYSPGTPPSGGLVTETFRGRSTTGTTIREANAGGNPPYKDVALAPVDQATFSILNPLAVRTAGFRLDGAAGYNLALPTSSAISNSINSLGPFSGVPTNANFADYQEADCNGNNVPNTAPVGGTITGSNGTVENTGQLPTNGNGQQRQLYTRVFAAVAPGFIAHGTSGNSATIDNAGTDPTATSYAAAGTTASTNPVPPSAGTFGDYGQSLLDIADRSNLGNLSIPLNLSMTQGALTWNDNSGSGGGMSVVNPLAWESMPTAKRTNGSGSPDYPNIAGNNTSVQLMARSTVDTPDANSTNPVGSGGLITSGSAILASANPGSTDDPSQRVVNPNALMVKIAIPRYQPANLESYAASTSTNQYSSSDYETRLQASGANVGEGYVGNYNAYATVASVNGATTPFNPRDAYRSVQLWVSVPVDLRTSITEQTIDLGNISAGYGLYLGGTGNDTAWSPFQQNDLLAPFYKPITIVNNGNTNAINLHLNQYQQYPDSTNTNLVAVPNPFAAYGVSSLSTVPSYDVPMNGTGGLTGTEDLPILRSSLDYFPEIPNSGPNQFNIYNFGWLGSNGFANQGTTVTPPGPVAPKARVGDSTGSVLTVPPVPHNNLGGASQALNSAAYNGRSVLSVAVPLGTPAGTYVANVSAFEGTDAPDANYPASLFPYVGPLYGGKLYTVNGWDTYDSSNTTGPVSVLSYYVNGSGGASPYQTISNPSTTVKYTVTEDRVTDGSPQPINNSNALVDTALPMVDPDTEQSAHPNSNDLQPWAFYDPSGIGSGPTFGLLWTSARGSTTASPALPTYGLYSSAMVAANENNAAVVNTPTNGTASWWSSASGVSVANGASQSYGASTYGTLSVTGVGDPINAIWVSTSVVNGETVYSLMQAQVTYTNNQPVFSNAQTLFTSGSPIYSPRASYYYNASLAGTGFTLPNANVGTGLTSGQYPLIVYYTKVGGRSTLMYWPAVSAPAASATQSVGTPTLSPAAVPLPAGISSASTPTIVARAPSAAGVPQVDIVFSGVLGTSATADIVTARYALTTNAAYGTPILTQAADLPLTAPASPPTVQANETLTTEPESLTAVNGTTTWAAHDIAWYHSASNGQFELTMNISGQSSPAILVPFGSTGKYDRSSGLWVFTINWSLLPAAYAPIATWWSGSVNTPVTVYANPNLGTVTFSTPLPSNTAIAGLGNFQSFVAYVDPMAMRTTFQSESNTAPISFIDNAIEPNAAPGQPNVSAERYWYVYRKQTPTIGNSSANTSVLYYDTRRLTVVLPTAISLNYSNGVYALQPITVMIGTANVTPDVDIDWSRGRIYFPEYLNGAPTEGQTVSVSYYPPNATSAVMDDSLEVTWQDEPSVNSPTQTAVIGEHVLPDSNPTDESDPSAFLDPNAYLDNAAGSVLNPEAATPAYENGQLYAHKVWVFWTSNRNAAAAGAGSDVYWETIDPRFQVLNP